jgi:hypothetical protein
MRNPNIVQSAVGTIYISSLTGLLKEEGASFYQYNVPKETDKMFAER